MLPTARRSTSTLDILRMCAADNRPSHGRLTGRIAFLFGFVLALSSSNSFSEDCPPRPRAFDGHWWTLLTSEERDGFLQGNSDCQSFELKRTSKYNHSFEETAEFVTSYYFQAERRSAFVLDVILLVNERPPRHKPLGGGERWAQPHGYWTGQWWREGGPADRLGFVEGYLACVASIPTPGRDTFSKAPVDYVHLINAWYKLDEESGDVDAEKEDVPIANALRPFRDADSK